VRKLLVTASVSLSLLIVGCAAKPHARSSTPTAAAAPAAAPAPDPRNKVIVNIVDQHRTITVTSSPNGLLYSLKDPSGRMQIADATPEKFAELQPQLYQQIQNYIAVQADDAPIPTAGADASIGAIDRDRNSFHGAGGGVSSDSFKRTSDRPFPTAREDAPQ
jgi:hypothetical protein